MSFVISVVRNKSKTEMWLVLLTVRNKRLLQELPVSTYEPFGFASASINSSWEIFVRPKGKYFFLISPFPVFIFLSLHPWQWKCFLMFIFRLTSPSPKPKSLKAKVIMLMSLVQVVGKFDLELKLITYNNYTILQVLVYFRISNKLYVYYGTTTI